MPNAFQHNAFQQVPGLVAFQLFVIGGSSGGRTEVEIDGRLWKKFQQPSITVHDAAVHLGRQGGLIGGPARAEAHTAKQLSKFAYNAAMARWR